MRIAAGTQELHTESCQLSKYNNLCRFHWKHTQQKPTNYVAYSPIGEAQKSRKYEGINIIWARQQNQACMTLHFWNAPSKVWNRVKDVTKPCWALQSGSRSNQGVNLYKEIHFLLLTHPKYQEQRAATAQRDPSPVLNQSLCQEHWHLFVGGEPGACRENSCKYGESCKSLP